MYAIIADGGRQFKVKEGQQLTIDYRNELSLGDEFTFDRVLALGGDEQLKLGSPVLDGASVTAEVVRVEQGKKIFVQKFRRRKNSRRRTGHRQLYTTVKINKISAP